MSKYETQMDSYYSICPYCEHKEKVEAEDYQESGLPVKCEECGKEYWLQTIISVTHLSKPDCTLNKQDHISDVRYPGFCRVCGQYLRKA